MSIYVINGQRLAVFWHLTCSWYESSIITVDIATAKCLVLFSDGEVEWINIMPWYFDGSSVTPICPRTCYLEELRGNISLAFVSCPLPVEVVSLLLATRPSITAPPYQSNTFQLYRNTFSAYDSWSPWSMFGAASTTSLTSRRASSSSAIPVRSQFYPSHPVNAPSSSSAHHSTASKRSTHRRSWSKHEDMMLFRLQAEIGNRWTEITKHLPGRTENQAKNRWHSVMRRHPERRIKIMRLLDRTVNDAFQFPIVEDEVNEEVVEDVNDDVNDEDGDNNDI